MDNTNKKPEEKVTKVEAEKLEIVEMKNFNGQKIEINKDNFGPVLVRQNANMYKRLGFLIKNVQEANQYLRILALATQIKAITVPPKGDK